MYIKATASSRIFSYIYKLSTMGKKHKYNIDSHDDHPSLNTSSCLNFCNIENGQKKSSSDWNAAVHSSNVQAPSFLELTMSNSQVIMPTTGHSEPMSEYPFDPDNTIVQSAQEESCGDPSTLTAIRIESIDETPQLKTDIQNFLEQEIEYDDIPELVAQQSDDADSLIIIDTSTTAIESIQRSEDYPLINEFFMQPCSNARTQGNLLETRMLSTSVTPIGFFRHPIASKHRMRYERELANNEISSKMTCIKDCFHEHPLYVGPYRLFQNQYVEITLLSATSDNYLIYSPHTMYRSNVPDDEKFSNPIRLRSDQLEIECGCLKLDIKVAKKLQDDFPQQTSSTTQHRWKKNQACLIKYYPSERNKEEVIKMTPRKLNKKYQLDKMFIAVRPVQLESNGNSYRAQPDSVLILSNRFLGVDSDDSPATWNCNDYKLSISEGTITNMNISADANENSKLDFTLTIPELYRCTLNSRTKELEIKLVTDEIPSEMYQIGFEETTRNPIYLAIHEAEMNVQLLISKEIGSRQNHLWLETSSKQVDHKGCNHFHVDISLQDVDTTHRRTYPHSSVQSKEFYDIALSTGIQEVFSTEENHLQQNDGMESVASGKRRYDQIDTLGLRLPVTKVSRTGEN